MASSVVDLRTELPSTADLTKDDRPVVFSDSQLQQLGWTKDPVDPAGNDVSDSSDAAAPRGTLSGRSRPRLSLPDMAPVLVPRLPEPAYHFDLRQQWEGTVIAVAQNEFRASLKDLTNLDTAPEEVTFHTEELFPGDLRRLVPGAVFRWSIGYKTQGGQRENVSRIQLARLPGWSKRAVERVEAEAAELQRLFSVSSPSI